MRRYGALFQLMVRSTIYKLLGVMAVMGVAEVGLFAAKLGTTWSPAQVAANGVANGVDVTAYYPYSLADLVKSTHLSLVWTIGVVVFCELLVYIAGRGRSETLDRLGLSRREVNVLYSIYHTMALVVLYAFQAAMAVGLCLLYCRSIDAAYVGPQTIFLAFYRVPLFHSVLPLGDWVRWLFNLVLLIALGVVTAAGGQKVRDGQRSIAAALLAFWGGNFSDQDLIGLNGGVAVFLIAVALFLVGSMLQILRPRSPWGEEEDDETEKTA